MAEDGKRSCEVTSTKACMPVGSRLLTNSTTTADSMLRACLAEAVAPWSLRADAGSLLHTPVVTARQRPALRAGYVGDQASSIVREQVIQREQRLTLRGCAVQTSEHRSSLMDEDARKRARLAAAKSGQQSDRLVWLVLGIFSTVAQGITTVGSVVWLRCNMDPLAGLRRTRDDASSIITQ